MALGQLHECWVCYESEKYKNPDLKQTCMPVRAKKGSVCEGLNAWLCSECRKRFKERKEDER